MLHHARQAGDRAGLVDALADEQRGDEVADAHAGLGDQVTKGRGAPQTAEPVLREGHRPARLGRGPDAARTAARAGSPHVRGVITRRQRLAVDQVLRRDLGGLAVEVVDLVASRGDVPVVGRRTNCEVESCSPRYRSSSVSWTLMPGQQAARRRPRGRGTTPGRAAGSAPRPAPGPGRTGGLVQPKAALPGLDVGVGLYSSRAVVELGHGLVVVELRVHRVLEVAGGVAVGEGLRVLAEDRSSTGTPR